MAGIWFVISPLGPVSAADQRWPQVAAAFTSLSGFVPLGWIRRWSKAFCL
jgi:hypothetical protein